MVGLAIVGIAVQFRVGIGWDQWMSGLCNKRYSSASLLRRRQYTITQSNMGAVQVQQVTAIKLQLQYDLAVSLALLQCTVSESAVCCS